MRINRIAVLNGFTGSGELADYYNLYHSALIRIADNDPVRFLDMLLNAKKAKNIVTSK